MRIERDSKQYSVTTQKTEARPFASCKASVPKQATCGPDIDYFERSDMTKNQKDAFGFRQPSAYSFMEHRVVNPEGRSDYTNKSSCDQTLTGYPGNIGYWHKETTDTSIPGRQSDGLLAQRAEADLNAADINLLQFAYFLPQTLSTIARSARNLGKLADDLARDPMDLSKAFGHKHFDPRSLFLQYLFVWNQGIRDIHGLCNLISDRAKHPHMKLLRGTSNNKATHNYVHSTQPYAWTVVGTSTCSGTKSIEQKAVSYARVVDSISAQRQALGLTNVAYLGWDIVKWSWVVDQFIDVGSFIGSLTSTVGLEFLGTSVTTVEKNIASVHLTPYHYQRGSQQYSCVPHYSNGLSSYTKGVRNVYMSPNTSINLRNPFQASTAMTSAVVAALSLNFKRASPNLLGLERLARKHKY